jgi:hypothetical protein
MFRARDHSCKLIEYEGLMESRRRLDRHRYIDFDGRDAFVGAQQAPPRVISTLVRIEALDELAGLLLTQRLESLPHAELVRGNGMGGEVVAGEPRAIATVLDSRGTGEQRSEFQLHG